MEKLNRTTANSPVPLPERILQFGGGNFLRGFVDWMVDVYNEKTGSDLGILVVKPTERGDYEDWKAQDGLFHVLTKGIRNGDLVDEVHRVKCVSRIVHAYGQWEAFLKSAENPGLRYIISNTTETGIRFSPNDQKTATPPHEFPAKLTLWLHRRFEHFKGGSDSGCVIIPTELLEQNGELLRQCILQYADAWQLEDSFKNWISEANIFCNTLVDRIIPGVGKSAMEAAWQQVGFQDEMITQGEPYHLWAIEAPLAVREELPLDKISLNIIYTDDLMPYRVSKVRILNGAHTVMVPVAYLYGLETVRETVEHEVMGQFVQASIFDEIMPTLDLPNMDVQQFANDVLDRFRNPFIKHQLISIALNAISKFKVRVLPSLLAFQREKGFLPRHIILSLAAYIRFYKGEYNGVEILLNDEPYVVEFFKNNWEKYDGSTAALADLVGNILRWEKAWGMDLSEVPGLHDLLVEYLTNVENAGMQATVNKVLA
ncbi:MAG: tagaturonate reductase [Bacteroidetes bacterium]|nr:tagaturonate reductase [Bacteroidota bacterium]